MGNIFAASEIVELGIQIEKNGMDFYSILARHSKITETARIFKYLAGEEEKHIAVFQEILEGAERYEVQGLDADEYFAYMSALASEYVFTRKDKGREIAQKIKSDKEAVDMGIGLEKDSILFYEGMKKIAPEYDLKIVGQLIAQEQSHLRQLTALKENLKDA